jgi:hypothetical protein
MIKTLYNESNTFKNEFFDMQKKCDDVISQLKKKENENAYIRYNYGKIYEKYIDLIIEYNEYEKNNSSILLTNTELQNKINEINEINEINLKLNSACETNKIMLQNLSQFCIMYLNTYDELINAKNEINVLKINLIDTNKKNLQIVDQYTQLYNSYFNVYCEYCNLYENNKLKIENEIMCEEINKKNLESVIEKDINNDEFDLLDLINDNVQNIENLEENDKKIPND